MSLRFFAVLFVTLVLGACQVDVDTFNEKDVATPTAESTATSGDDSNAGSPAYAAPGPFGVGFQTLTAEEGLDAPLQISAWYPALISDGANQDIEYDVTLKDVTWSPTEPPRVHGHALADAAADSSSGPYPLVVLSHGFSLSTASYSALAEHYASYGFVVLAPEHAEQFDESMGDLWKALIDRPADVTHVLDYAETLTADDGSLAGLIDMENVAVVGHSYGGYTALASAGARFDLDAFNARCADTPEDDPASFLCAALVPHEAEMAERAGLDAIPDGLWSSFGDARVTAIVSMAGDSYLFDIAGLSHITVPVMAMGGTADTGTPYVWGAEPTYEYVSSTDKALVGFEGAEHMIFTTPCENQPWLGEHPMNEYFCVDPAWDRDQARDLIHHFSTAFLLETLKNDQPAEQALAPGEVEFPGIDYTTTMN